MGAVKSQAVTRAIQCAQHAPSRLSEANGQARVCISPEGGRVFQVALHDGEQSPRRAILESSFHPTKGSPVTNTPLATC